MERGRAASDRAGRCLRRQFRAGVCVRACVRVSGRAGQCLRRQFRAVCMHACHVRVYVCCAPSGSAPSGRMLHRPLPPVQLVSLCLGMCLGCMHALRPRAGPLLCQPVKSPVRVCACACVQCDVSMPAHSAACVRCEMGCDECVRAMRGEAGRGEVVMRCDALRWRLELDWSLRMRGTSR